MMVIHSPLIPVHIVVGEAVYWVDDGSGPYTVPYSFAGAWTPFRTPGVGCISISREPMTITTTPSIRGPFMSPTMCLRRSSLPVPRITPSSPRPRRLLLPPTLPIRMLMACPNVEFYVGANLVDDVFSSPFATDVTNLVAGNYTLTVIAYDNVGASATNSITILVQRIPPRSR